MRASATKIKERSGHMIWRTMIRQTKVPSQNPTPFLAISSISLTIIIQTKNGERWLLHWLFGGLYEVSVSQTTVAHGDQASTVREGW